MVDITPPQTLPAFIYRIRREAAEKEQSIITALIAKYRGGQLSDRDAVLGIAEISGLRSFVTTLERTTQKENTNA